MPFRRAKGDFTPTPSHVTREMGNLNHANIEGRKPLDKAADLCINWHISVSTNPRSQLSCEVSSMASRAKDLPDGQRWWSHVASLASDKFEGRQTGSAGFGVALFRFRLEGAEHISPGNRSGGVGIAVGVTRRPRGARRGRVPGWRTTNNCATPKNAGYLGIGTAVGGDSIYDGAMDNAAGVASLLDVAAILTESGIRPRRSVLFVSFTGEEDVSVNKWRTERYHAPSDDLTQPVDKEAARAFDVLVAKLLERIANRDERPRWKDSSFFKRFAR
jgi:Peptidase family M28